MSDGRSLPQSHFDGAPLTKMREWVEDGTPESQFSKAKSWQDEQKYMADLAQRVKDRMSKAGVSIEGESGEAMQNAVAPVALWAEVAADNAEAQGQRMQSQGEAFKKVQNSIPKKGEEQHPPEDNFLESVGSSLGVCTSDNEVADQHNEKLRQEAVTAFQGYDNTSQNNVQSSAVFTEPPEAGKTPIVASGPQPPQAGGVDTGGMSSGSGSEATQSASAGGGSAGGAAGGGSAGAGAHGGAGHSPSTSSPSGTSPSSSAPAPPQPWQQGTLEPPRGGAQGGAGGFAGAMPGGGGAGGGAAGGGKAGGASGSGSGSGAGGRAGGAGGSAGGRGALGPGGASGSGGGSAGGQSGSSSGGAGGGRGGAGGGGMGGRGAGSQGEEDEEHYSPEFLKGDYGFFDEDVPRVAPPVFGDNQ